MSVDTSLSPYYDDYSEDKEFYKILYKPGVAVQSRELNQSQTILQNQVKRVGDYLFTNGDKVTGPKPIINLNARHIKLQNFDVLGNFLNVNNLLNTYVISPTNDIIGYVEYVYDSDFLQVGATKSIVITLKKFSDENQGNFKELEELRFYTNYTDALDKRTPQFTALVIPDSAVNIFCTVKAFDREVLLSQNSNLIREGDELIFEGLPAPVFVSRVLSQREILLSEPPQIDITNERVSFVNRACNPTSILTQDSAVFYNNGYFLKSTLQSIVPDIRTAYPYKYIGYYYQESVVDSIDDNSLLDPAVGSSNYFAPGADRLKINLKLATVDFDENGNPNTKENFLPIVKLVNGQIDFVKEISGYSDLDRKLAQRTYDQAGSYVVNDFKLIPIETTVDTEDLIFNVGPGKAYVGGYEVQTIAPTLISIPKNLTTETEIKYNINTTQGNFYKIQSVQGSLFNIDQIFQHKNFLEAHNVENPTDSSTKVGDVEVRNIEYDSMNGTTVVYKLFINSFSAVPEAPLGWPEWAAKYKIPENSARQLAELLYSSNNELPYKKAVVYRTASGIQQTITPASGTRFYALNREPDTQGIAFWWNIWKNANFSLEEIAHDFIAAALENEELLNGIDTFARLTSNTKPFLSVINNSPFYDGVNNVGDIKSVVGVSNKFTQHISSASYNNPFFKALVSPSGRVGNNIVTFDRKNSDTLIFDTNKYFVKELKNISTEYFKTTTSAVFVSGVYTKSFSLPESFVLGDGIIPPSIARQNIIMIVKSGQTNDVPLGAWNFELGQVTVAGSSLSVTIDTGDSSFSGIADISFKIENDNVVPRQKTAVNNQFRIINIELADKDYDIGISDIHKYNGIYRLGNTANFVGEWNSETTYTFNQVVLSNGMPFISQQTTTNVPVNFGNAWVRIAPDEPALYVLDGGQRDNMYDHGSIRYVGGGVPGTVLISFDYYTHTGDGPLTVQSYPEYQSIGTYRSVIDSREYELRDCLDFRPRRIDNTPFRNFDPAIFPVSSVNTEVDIEYYLGRYDRIYVTNRNDNFSSPYNRFYVETGIQTDNPEEPVDQSDLNKLAIATLAIPPFTVSAFDVVITYEDNRRYTMKDIGRIEDLSIRLDKVIRLQSVEISILKSIVTNEDGDILLKSGILSEDFSSLEKSELAAGYFACAIDEVEKECFPGFAAYNLDLFVETPGEIFVFNDIITKKFEEELYVSNLEANGFINVNPSALDDGKGRAIVSKKNSFSLNLLNSAGSMIISSIAIKSIAAYFAVTANPLTMIAYPFAKGSFSNYALTAAFKQEGALQIIWGATRDLGMNFYNAVTSIDGLVKFVTDSISPYFDIVSAVYNWASKGITTLLNGFGGVGGGGSVAASTATASTAASATAGSLSAVIGSGVTTFGQGITLLGQGVSHILQGNVATGLSGIGTGILTISTAIVSTTLNAAIVVSSNLAVALHGVPILGTAAKAISAGIYSASSFILSSPVLTVIAAVAIVYVAVKIVQKVWKTIKKWFSDDRMKEDIHFIKRMDNGLNLYSFRYKKEFQDIAGKGYHKGCLASEVEKLYPAAVSLSDNGYKIVDYSKIRMA